MKNDKNTGSQLELTSLMTEYENQFDRSNKLDNKVYITITFCGFLFVFITGLFNGISKLGKPGNGLQMFVSALYILSCIAVMGAYAYVLVFFMRLLQPEQISRMGLYRANLRFKCLVRKSVRFQNFCRRPFQRFLRDDL
mgnify:CR=1 FL=1